MILLMTFKILDSIDNSAVHCDLEPNIYVNFTTDMVHTGRLGEGDLKLIELSDAERILGC